MEPTLRADDLVLIDRSTHRPDREGIYVMRLGEMLLVKRLQAIPGDKVRIISDNPAFDSWTLDLTRLVEEVKIYGRVIWAGRKF